MGILEGIEEVLEEGLKGAHQGDGGQAPPVTPPTAAGPAQTPVGNVDPVQGPTVGRPGTFILPDVYPLDPTGQLPPFQVLPGNVVMGKEVAGCYLKATDGVGWNVAYEQWFETNWGRMAQVRAQRRPGTEFRRGAYHFLIFSEDGAAQADYFTRIVRAAGGWGPQDLMPWVDVEAGGQGAWNHGVEDLSTLPAVTRASMAADVRRVTTAYIARLKENFPGIRVGLYGRGIFRDLGMTDCVFGADAVCNPSYTPHPAPMDAYGWPIERMREWQLCGDGNVVVPGYPRIIPGWGATDYSVVVNGVHPTTTADLDALSAFPGA